MRPRVTIVHPRGTVPQGNKTTANPTHAIRIITPPRRPSLLRVDTPLSSYCSGISSPSPLEDDESETDASDNGSDATTRSDNVLSMATERLEKYWETKVHVRADISTSTQIPVVIPRPLDGRLDDLHIDSDVSTNPSHKSSTLRADAVPFHRISFRNPYLPVPQAPLSSQSNNWGIQRPLMAPPVFHGYPNHEYAHPMPPMINHSSMSNFNNGSSAMPRTFSYGHQTGDTQGIPPMNHSSFQKANDNQYANQAPFMIPPVLHSNTDSGFNRTASMMAPRSQNLVNHGYGRLEPAVESSTFEHSERWFKELQHAEGPNNLPPNAPRTPDKILVPDCPVIQKLAQNLRVPLSAGDDFGSLAFEIDRMGKYLPGCTTPKRLPPKEQPTKSIDSSIPVQTLGGDPWNHKHDQFCYETPQDHKPGGEHWRKWQEWTPTSKEFSGQYIIGIDSKQLKGPLHYHRCYIKLMILRKRMQDIVPVLQHQPALRSYSRALKKGLAICVTAVGRERDAEIHNGEGMRALHDNIRDFESMLNYAEPPALRIKKELLQKYRKDQMWFEPGEEPCYELDSYSWSTMFGPSIMLWPSTMSSEYEIEVNYIILRTMMPQRFDETMESRVGRNPEPFHQHQVAQGGFGMVVR